MDIQEEINASCDPQDKIQGTMCSIALQTMHYAVGPFVLGLADVWSCRNAHKVFDQLQNVLDISVQFSSVAQSYPTLCDPMNHSTPGLPVHHQLREFTQTHVHQVGDTIQPLYLILSKTICHKPNMLMDILDRTKFQGHFVCLVIQLCLTLCTPMDCSPPCFSVHGDSPDKNTGVGCHALLQGIFPTQGSNPGLPHCR